MQDLSNRIKLDKIMTLDEPTDSSVTSDIVDCSGFNSVMIQIIVGAVDVQADSNLYFVLQHSDTKTASDFVSVTAKDVANIDTVTNGVVFTVDGNPVAFKGKGGNPSDYGLNYKFSYVGPKRYIRLVSQEGGSTDFVYGANSIKSIAQYSDSNIIQTHPVDQEFYSDGLISIDQSAGTTVNGRGTTWVGKIEAGDSLEFTYTRIAYNTGEFSGEYPIGTTNITFTGTTLVTTWANPKLYVDTQGTGIYTDFGSITINTATTITLGTTSTEDISASDNWYIDYDRSSAGSFNAKVSAVSNDNTLTIGTAFTETVFFQNYRIYYA